MSKQKHTGVGKKKSPAATPKPHPGFAEEDAPPFDHAIDAVRQMGDKPIKKH